MSSGGPRLYFNMGQNFKWAFRSRKKEVKIWCQHVLKPDLGESEKDI